MLKDHALNNDGIPLIGIAPSEVEERCDGCGDPRVHLTAIRIVWPNRFLCRACRMAVKSPMAVTVE